MFYCKHLLNFRKNNDCPAKLDRKVAENTYIAKKEHNHLIDIRDVEVKHRINDAKKKARETDKPNREIFAEMCQNTPEEVLVQLPNNETLSRRLRSQRLKKNNLSKKPSTHDEIKLDDVKTNDDEPFVMFDSGFTEAKGRIIMFSTMKNMDFLAKCNHIHMDGTFSICPDLFQQVYVIHGKMKQWN